MQKANARVPVTVLTGFLGFVDDEVRAQFARMKGVLSIAGQDQRFVFQGVHMLFDGRPDRPWGREPRTNDRVFIGRHLDRAALEEGFRRCLR